ncbi:hypothetical protein LCGC14_2905130, partial [marine sediment metagenome]
MGLKYGDGRKPATIKLMSAV